MPIGMWRPECGYSKAAEEPLAGGVRPTRPVVTRSSSCHDCLVRELAYDPFILAIGHVALASPWFEADVGHLYGTIVNTPEARQWVSGRNCSEVSVRAVQT